MTPASGPDARASGRIVHVNLAPTFRGGERQTELLIRANARAGLSQRAVVRRGAPLAERLRDVPELDLCPIARPFPAHLRRLTSGSLVHAHETRAAQLGLLAHAWSRVPYVITRRVPNRPKANPFTRALYRRAAAVVSISSAIQRVMTEYAPEAAHARIPSMAAGFTAPSGEAETIRAAYPDRLLVVHAGALVERHKAQHVIIDAARELANDSEPYSFLLLGEGPDEQALRARADGLDHVHFLGFRSDIASYLAAADLFLYPSLEEGLGSALLDAMAAALPIVASDTGGIPEIVRDGHNGFLVPPGDVAGVVDALRRLGKNANLRTRMGQAGHEMSLEYGAEAISARYRALYTDILDNG